MMRIAIIGGGIGGLTAALALRRAGFEPEVFEQAPELLEVGAAIAVWPNAMRVLQRLNVGSEVLKRSGMVEQVRWLSFDGRLFKQLGFPLTNAPAVALHRADLQGALMHALPAGSIHLGKQFESYRQEGDLIHASFADGTSLAFDMLVGADGIHSRARAQALGDGPPVYRGYTVWRGVTASTPRSLVPAVAMEIYGHGQRFGIGPVGQGRTGWWATANESAEAFEPPPERQKKLLALFDNWCEPVLELIGATPATMILRSATHDRAPVRKWGEGKMTLLGDAAHPTTPNLGQGGCMAIEDGAILARCFSKYPEASQALRMYERHRQARTSAITRYSRRYGIVGQWAHPSASGLRGTLLTMLPPSLGRKLLRLIFDYDAYRVSI